MGCKKLKATILNKITIISLIVYLLTTAFVGMIPTEISPGHSLIKITVGYGSSGGSGVSVDIGISYDDWDEVQRKNNPGYSYFFTNLGSGEYNIEACSDNMWVGSKENIYVSSGEDKSVTIVTHYEKYLAVEVHCSNCETQVEDANVKLYFWGGYNHEWDQELSGNNSNGEWGRFRWSTTKSGERYKVYASHNGNSDEENPVTFTSDKIVKVVLDENPLEEPGSIEVIVRYVRSGGSLQRVNTAILYEDNYDGNVSGDSDLGDLVNNSESSHTVADNWTTNSSLFSKISEKVGGVIRNINLHFIPEADVGLDYNAAEIHNFEPTDYRNEQSDGLDSLIGQNVDVVKTSGVRAEDNIVYDWNAKDPINSPIIGLTIKKIVELEEGFELEGIAQGDSKLFLYNRNNAAYRVEDNGTLTKIFDNVTDLKIAGDWGFVYDKDAEAYKIFDVSDYSIIDEIAVTRNHQSKGRSAISDSQIVIPGDNSLILLDRELNRQTINVKADTVAISETHIAYSVYKGDGSTFELNVAPVNDLQNLICQRGERNLVIHDIANDTIAVSYRNNDTGRDPAWYNIKTGEWFEKEINKDQSEIRTNGYEIFIENSPQSESHHMRVSTCDGGFMTELGENIPIYHFVSGKKRGSLFFSSKKDDRFIIYEQQMKDPSVEFGEVQVESLASANLEDVLVKGFGNQLINVSGWRASAKMNQAYASDFFEQSHVVLNGQPHAAEINEDGRLVIRTNSNLSAEVISQLRDSFGYSIHNVLRDFSDNAELIKFDSALFENRYDRAQSETVNQSLPFMKDLSQDAENLYHIAINPINYKGPVEFVFRDAENVDYVLAYDINRGTLDGPEDVINMLLPLWDKNAKLSHLVLNKEELRLQSVSIPSSAGKNRTVQVGLSEGLDDFSEREIVSGHTYFLDNIAPQIAVRLQGTNLICDAKDSNDPFVYLDATIKWRYNDTDSWKTLNPNSDESLEQFYYDMKNIKGITEFQAKYVVKDKADNLNESNVVSWAAVVNPPNNSNDFSLEDFVVKYGSEMIIISGAAVAAALGLSAKSKKEKKPAPVREGLSPKYQPPTITPTAKPKAKKHFPVFVPLPPEPEPEIGLERLVLIETPANLRSIVDVAVDIGAAVESVNYDLQAIRKAVPGLTHVAEKDRNYLAGLKQLLIATYANDMVIQGVSRKSPEPITRLEYYQSLDSSIASYYDLFKKMPSDSEIRLLNVVRKPGNMKNLLANIISKGKFKSNLGELDVLYKTQYNDISVNVCRSRDNNFVVSDGVLSAIIDPNSNAAEKYVLELDVESLKGKNEMNLAIRKMMLSNAAYHIYHTFLRYGDFSQKTPAISALPIDPFNEIGNTHFEGLTAALEGKVDYMPWAHQEDVVFKPGEGVSERLDLSKLVMYGQCELYVPSNRVGYRTRLITGIREAGEMIKQIAGFSQDIHPGDGYVVDKGQVIELKTPQSRASIKGQDCHYR